jgi:hypothetical protein
MIDADSPEVVTLSPGTWCEFRLDAGGDGRADGRLELVRRKNVAFLAWDRAVLACERRRHASGTVPASWVERVRELEREYRAAVEALEV